MCLSAFPWITIGAGVTFLIMFVGGCVVSSVCSVVWVIGLSSSIHSYSLIWVSSTSYLLFMRIGSVCISVFIVGFFCAGCFVVPSTSAMSLLLGLIILHPGGAQVVCSLQLLMTRTLSLTIFVWFSRVFNLVTFTNYLNASISRGEKKAYWQHRKAAFQWSCQPRPSARPGARVVLLPLRGKRNYNCTFYCTFTILLCTEHYVLSVGRLGRDFGNPNVFLFSRCVAEKVFENYILNSLPPHGI